MQQVDAKPIASFEVNTNALANLQSEITSQLGELKVNEALPTVQLSVTLHEIFKAVNAHGPVEYFAGMKGENQDHNTSVAGIKVAVDNMGVLTISGTPLEASTNGEFYIAAGIHPDAEDRVVSEMTRIALPEVKAADTTLPPVSLGFTKEHFNNQQWVMGSFADSDGEVGYAALLNHNGQLQMCWGDKKINDQRRYKGNISRSRDFSHQLGGPTPFEVLRKLDQQSGYLNYEHKNCWAVTLNSDGTLADTSNQRIKILYQNQLVDGSYQLLIQYGPVQLFWLDSSETTFSDTLAINKKITAGTTEYALFVEAGDYVQEFDGPMLSYSYMETQFKEGRFDTISILPDGFENYGVWSVISTSDGQRIEQAEELEDEKTRIRYLQRDFGDFYIGVEWSKETNNTESNAGYSLFSHDKELMDKLIRHFPIMQD